ncbi:MAG: hypothetical protein QOJ07_1163 [Thermoleophilaceae bacterium]|nr:hypothetical protein [Thermoleophilaceae bacterium]
MNDDDGEAGFALESNEPIAAYAVIRLELVCVGLLSTAILDFDHDGRLAVLLATIALPLALAIWFLARRAPAVALSPGVAIVDLASLTSILLLVPAAWAALQFCALVLAMAYPLVRGERAGIVFALATVGVIVPAALLAELPVDDHRLLFYEMIFGVATVAGATFAGRVSASEHFARVRARELTRRIIEAGNRARHEVAQSLHDGPVQELVGVGMQINGAINAAERGDEERARELLEMAREGVERNVGALRNELIGLGPVAFDELSFQEAIEQCAPAWGRRYDIDVQLELARLDMPNAVCGALFGIAQEAVANAGRHADAEYVRVTLRNTDGVVEMSVSDDGRGFGDISPLGPREPGHLGLASMRERAAIVGGQLAIESGAGGTEVRVRLPADRVL